MGKSTTPACFRIISCGGDSVDHDDLQTPESKASGDRRGWSFRKRSARHRILSNSVTSEAPASASKESQESISVNSQVQHDLTVAEKTTETQQKEEKTIKTQQKEEKATEIHHTEEKTAEIERKEEKSTEIPQKDDKSSEIPQKEDKSSEIQQKEDNSTEFQHEEEKTPEIQQREEKTAEIQQKEEKSTEIQQKDDSELLDAKASSEDFLGADAPPDEASIILIQTAIRGLLARRVVLKEKSITKLQAVVRGHIVRRHAVGTLRCVQAIIKMQALVRARHAHLQIKKKAKASHSYTYVSIEKLLGNAFARQLMDATPRTKPINIKCDSSKSDSAWQWLERWMSVSSVSNEEPHETETAVEQHKDNLEHSVCNGEDLSVQIISKSMDSESGFDASDNNSMTKSDVNSSDVRSGEFISPLSNHCNLQSNDQSNSKIELDESAPTAIKNADMVEAMEPDCLSKKEESQSEQEVLNEVVEVEYIPEKEETGIIREAPDSEEFSSLQSETEVKKLPRKASNPAFIAAQSKFEELSLATTSPKLGTSSHDPGVESSFDKDSSGNQDQPFMSEDKDSGFAGNSSSNASAAQRGSSECGTELSVSSTLDSPARSGEAGVDDSGMEIKASDEIGHPKNGENLEVEAKSIVPESDPSSDNTTMLERNESVDSVCGQFPNSAIPAADTPEVDKPADPSHIQAELGSETRNKLSPEASPRNDAAIPEVLATPSPSSQVSSAKSKKSKGGKTKSIRKSKPSPDDKNLSNHTPDSASRTSLEQLQEPKSGKRRNSLGSAKSDLKEQEPRDSSSSNSLPSYMQATESAKAKAIVNGSPRSSPDVNDKEIHLKKRHSLPGSSDRQGSPRVNRSLSQAQQNAKGNASQSPQDRKWRR